MTHPAPRPTLYIGINDVLTGAFSSEAPYAQALINILSHKFHWGVEVFDPQRVERLRQLRDATNARIVVCSSWRNLLLDGGIKRLFETQGARDLVDDVLVATDRLDGKDNKARAIAQDLLHNYPWQHQFAVAVSIGSPGHPTSKKYPNRDWHRIQRAGRALKGRTLLDPEGEIDWQLNKLQHAFAKSDRDTCMRVYLGIDDVSEPQE